MPDDRGRLRQRFAAAVRNAASLPESPDAAQPNCTRRVADLTCRLCALTLVVGVVLAGCASEPFDRDAAIQRVVDEGRGTVSPDQAACYVDRVRDELGTAALRPAASPDADQTARLTSIRIDCMGVAALGDAADDVTATTFAGDLAGPRQRGDDPALDALWDRCAAGFGQACDDLFDRSQLGSDYEDFGVTCGRRTREARCADVYPSPGVTLPSAAQPTTTVPPAAP